VITIRRCTNSRDQVLHISSDVTGLTEFSRIGLDERKHDQFAICLTKYVCLLVGPKIKTLLLVYSMPPLLRVLFLQPANQIDVVVVVANRNRQRLFASSCRITKRSRCAFTCLGVRRNSSGSKLCAGWTGGSSSVVSGWVNAATDTLSQVRLHETPGSSSAALRATDMVFLPL